MKLPDMKISTRVTAAFGVVLVTIGVTAAGLQWSLARSQQTTQAMADSIELQGKVAAVHLLAKDNAIDGMMVLVSSSAEQQAKLKKDIEQRDTQVASGLQALEEAAAGSPDEAAELAALRRQHATYKAGVRRIVDMVLAGKQAEATFAADEEMIPMLAPFLKGLASLDAKQTARARTLEAANRQLTTSARWLSTGSALAVAVMAVAAGVWLVISITRPLSRAVAFAKRVSEGDLSAQIDAKGHDEVATLLQALSSMSSKLAHIVGQVRHSSDSIATGSAEIATGNQDLSQRTELQASSLQQTASSLEELSSTVQTNAQTAAQADKLASQASVAAVQGGDKVGAVVATMDDIAEASKKIADIIGVIDGIAFQTNILALNAAVEAARAGEQGRGFAVVASEVRTLAGRSAEAAKTIKALISASVEKVETGTHQVHEAGASMANIVAQVKSVSELLAQISGATAEQSSGIHLVGSAVTQLDHSTQQNAALVEQSAAAAESLRQQAEAMAEMVRVFKLGAGAPA